MSASDIRSHYSTMLLAAIEDTEFPSPAMLARVESGIGDVATLEQYIKFTIGTRMHGSGLPIDDLKALARYVREGLPKVQRPEASSAVPAPPGAVARTDPR